MDNSAETGRRTLRREGNRRLKQVKRSWTEFVPDTSLPMGANTVVED